MPSEGIHSNAFTMDVYPTSGEHTALDNRIEKPTATCLNQYQHGADRCPYLVDGEYTHGQWYSINYAGVVAMRLQYPNKFDFHSLRIRWVQTSTLYRPTAFSVYACTDDTEATCPMPDGSSFAPSGAGWQRIGNTTTGDSWPGEDPHFQTLSRQVDKVVGLTGCNRSIDLQIARSAQM